MRTDRGDRNRHSHATSHEVDAGEHDDDVEDHVSFTREGAIPPTSRRFGHAGRPSASETAFAHPGRGEAGMVTGELAVTIMGEAQTLPRGTYVEVESITEDRARCRVFSGHKGHTALIPLAMLRQQPALSDHYRDEMDRGGYMDYKGVLWKKSGPSPTDIDQGRVNDCAILSVAAAAARGDRRNANGKGGSGPQIIKNAFAPNDEMRASSYQVRLHQRDKESGDLTPVTTSVDRSLPSKGDLKDGRGEPIYAGRNHRFNSLDTADEEAPIWPLLLEKAYAQLDKSGYEGFEDGGSAMAAMEILTGEQAAYAMVGPAVDPDIGRKLSSLMNRGVMVVCNTRSDPASIRDRRRLGFSGWHFYSFIGRKDGKLLFHNPHGQGHCELAPEDFHKVFATIQVGTGGSDEGSSRTHGGARGIANGDGGDGRAFADGGARGIANGDGGDGSFAFAFGGARGIANGDGGGGNFQFHASSTYDRRNGIANGDGGDGPGFAPTKKPDRD